MRSWVAASLVLVFLGCSSSDDGGLGTGGGDGSAAGSGGTGALDAAGGTGGSPDSVTSDASATGGTDSSGDAGHPDAAEATGPGADTGGNGSDTAAASPLCMSSVVGTGAPALIDDFEDGDHMLLANDGRVGGWSISKSPSAVTVPAIAGPLTPVAGGVGAPTSKALHVSGTDATGWGADITVNLVYNEGTACYDASAYSGIKLSIKGRDGAKVYIMAKVATIRAMETTAGHYRKEQVLTAAWQEVTLRWADFGPSWGTPPEPKMVNPRELYSISVQTTPGASGAGEFDVWIDNVELTRN